MISPARIASLPRTSSPPSSLATCKTINLIIKADVQGSVETLAKTVTDQNTEEVKVRVIHSGVGAINESDVELAMATKTKPTDNRVAIIGFHVMPDEAARQLAEQNHVDVKLYRVIYEIFDDLKKALSGMLDAGRYARSCMAMRKCGRCSRCQRVGNIAGCMCHRWPHPARQQDPPDPRRRDHHRRHGASKRFAVRRTT